MRLTPPVPRLARHAPTGRLGVLGPLVPVRAVAAEPRPDAVEALRRPGAVDRVPVPHQRGGFLLEASGLGQGQPRS